MQKHTREIEMSRIILPMRVHCTLGVLNCVLLACGPNFAEADCWPGADWLLKVDAWALLCEFRNTPNCSRDSVSRDNVLLRNTQYFLFI